MASRTLFGTVALTSRLPTRSTTSQEFPANSGDAICTRKVVAAVDRPQDIEEEAAMRFFGGEEGEADLSQGWV
jgi:hypothetical protein